MRTLVSACIEILFEEAGDYPERITAAGAAGCNAVEMWFSKHKNPLAVKTALETSGVPLRLMLAGPVLPLTDPDNRNGFVASMTENFKKARTFGTETLIVQSGNESPEMSRNEQQKNVREALAEAADLAEEAGITLLYEPLNTLIDHKGYFADDSFEAIELLRDINSPALRMLLDIYHASVMKEDVLEVMKGNLDLIAHVHIADTNGRHEPGSGDIDYPKIFRHLYLDDYSGSFGLEYYPVGDSAETVAGVVEMIRAAGFQL